MDRYRVGIAGATGLVGQRLVAMLQGHPWFELTAVAASDRSAGRTYGEAVDWRLGSAPPAAIASEIVRPCNREAFEGRCDLVFSALDSAIARALEPELAAAGLAVVSNSSALRMDPEVPLVVPEVNPDHVEMLSSRARSGKGYVVTNPNCSTIGLAMVVAPLHEAFGVRRLVVSTLQAVSGAGLSGPAALQLLDNVLPYIPDEEEKLEQELGKLLGRLEGESVVHAEIATSAHCHRVGTTDGHLEAVSMELGREVDPSDVQQTLERFRRPGVTGELPSAPERPLVLRAEPDRPQPRLDRDAGQGMAVVVGRIRTCPVLGVKLELLSHNTIRGAAGGTLLVGELLAGRGLLTRRSTT